MDLNKAQKERSNKIGFQPLKDDQASLIWDEYKYRHDLIWKHMIRSTLAVIALITISYSTKFDVNGILVLVSCFLAICYIIFTMVVAHYEIKLLDQVKETHRKNQYVLYGIHMQQYEQGIGSLVNFRYRVFAFLICLLVLAIVVFEYEIIKNSVKIVWSIQKILQ